MHNKTLKCPLSILLSRDREQKARVSANGRLDSCIALYGRIKATAMYIWKRCWDEHVLFLSLMLMKYSYDGATLTFVDIRRRYSKGPAAFENI